MLPRLSCFGVQGAMGVSAQDVFTVLLLRQGATDTTIPPFSRSVLCLSFSFHLSQLHQASGVSGEQSHVISSTCVSLR